MTEKSGGTSVSAGDKREMVLVERLHRTQIVQYAGASGDFNPLHTDERYALEFAGQATVIAHGMLTMGMAGRVVTDWFGAENVTSFSGRFVAPVRPGDRLVAKAEVNRIDQSGSLVLAELQFEVANQEGDVVMSGAANVRLA